MAFDRETLESILAATGGQCHRCRLPLDLSGHAQRGSPGAWEIDVTRPQPKSTVLLPACISCLPASAATTMRRREGAAREAGPTTPVRIGYAGRTRAMPTNQR